MARIKENKKSFIDKQSHNKASVSMGTFFTLMKHLLSIRSLPQQQSNTNLPLFFPRYLTQ